MQTITPAYEPWQVYGAPVSAIPWWGCGYLMRWTWRVTRFLDDRVYEHVANSFHAWGVSASLADLLGELAVDHTNDVRKLAPCRYVAVSAMIEGFRVTVSVAPAHGPADPHGAPMPNRGRPFLERRGGALAWRRARACTQASTSPTSPPCRPRRRVRTSQPGRRRPKRSWRRPRRHQDHGPARYPATARPAGRGHAARRPERRAAPHNDNINPRALGARASRRRPLG